MSFLCGTIAGVRSHLSGFGTGVGNGGRSRRHTISTVVTSASSPCLPPSGRGPAGILKAEKPNTDRAGRITVQGSESPTKRSRRKSVTFSSVDLITHLPTVAPAASSQTRSSKYPEFPVSTRRNSTSSSPISSLPSGNRRVMNDHPTDSPRTRRYTVSGPPVPPGFPKSQRTDHASYSPLDWEGNHDSRHLPSPKSTQHHARSRRHTTLGPPPSGYVALGHQNSFSSPGGSWYNPSSTSLSGVTQEMAFLPGGNRSSPLSFGILPSIDVRIGQHYSPLPTYNPYEYPPHLHSAQGYRIEGYQPPQYSIYRVDSPPVVISPTTYFSEPAHSESPITYSSEYTILPLASRFSPTPYPHPECLALLDTRTASLVLSHFPPPKCIVQGTGKSLISYARNKKGLGVFAQKPLRTGEIILTEVPTLIIPADVPRFLQISGSAVDAQVVSYERMFELLSDGVKRELVDLAWGGAHGDYRSDANEYEIIMRINPLAVSLPLSSALGNSTTSGSNVSSIHRGIFLKTSRCNHSCGPNAQWTFDSSSLTLFLTCLRPINTGDEITITYNSPYLPFFHRRAELKNLFDFDCNCDSCFRILSQFQENIRSHLIEESDSARKFLTTFWDSYPSFEAWSKNPSIYPANLLISAHKVALEMIEQEGLEELSSIQHSPPQCYTSNPPSFGPVPIPDTIRHTDGIALCYGVFSDVVNFRKWMARALDARLSHSGSRPEVACSWGAFEDIGGNGKSGLPDIQSQTENVRKVLEKWTANPEMFPAWGLRGFDY